MPETVLDPAVRIMEPTVETSALDKDNILAERNSSENLAPPLPPDSEQDEKSPDTGPPGEHSYQCGKISMLLHSNSNEITVSLPLQLPGEPEAFIEIPDTDDVAVDTRQTSYLDQGPKESNLTMDGPVEDLLSVIRENTVTNGGDHSSSSSREEEKETLSDSLPHHTECSGSSMPPSVSVIQSIGAECRRADSDDYEALKSVTACSVSRPLTPRPSPEPEKRSQPMLTAQRPRSSHFRADSPSLLTSTPRSRISSVPCSGQHGQRVGPPLSSPAPSPVASYRLTSVVDSPVPPTGPGDGPMSLPLLQSGSKSYDYLLKVLLVGDSDVGKQEIITGMEDGSLDSPYCSSTGAAYKTTIILIDGKKVKLHIWDTSGQGRFCTIIRSYSRGAQGILLVYDITNRWSFEGIERWVREVEEHAPGIPKVLVGNRLHLAFKRQVDPLEAEAYAEKNNMGFYEISPLVNFNITESFQELCRMALKRNGMERLWRSNKVLSLHELCCHAIVARTNVYGIDRLPLPDAIKANLKSYALTSHPVNRAGQAYRTLKDRKKKGAVARGPADAAHTKCVNVSRKSCVIT